MSRLLGAVCLGVAATAAAAAALIGHEVNPVRTARAESAESTQSARVIVKFKARSSTLAATSVATSTATGPRAASALGARIGVALADGRALNEHTQVMTASGTSSSLLAARIATDADVEWAVVDRRMHVMTAPNDPLYPGGLTATTPATGQWYLRAPDSTVKSGIDIEPAWDVTRNDNSGTAASASAIVVADVDTGITVHPDLKNKLFYTGTVPYGYDFVGYAVSGAAALATANDGTLADADPTDPGDWVSATDISGGSLGSDCTSDDVENSSWHGTQTAGILGAQTGNAVGMAGTGYGTMVVPVRALGKCGGYESDIVAAIQWAGGIAMANVPTNAHPARVINMSLGGDADCDSAYQEALTALRNKGVFVVAAAGNGTEDPTTQTIKGSALFTPANCKPATSDTDQTPVVIAVAALRHAGTKVGFSNLGPGVTISAPGGNCVNTAQDSACLYPILTTSNAGTTTAGTSTYTTSGADASLGTSFSAPQVSGTVALMLAASPQLTNAQVISLLKSTARAFPTTSDTGITTACVDPGSRTSPNRQDECICTTATCGGGMLNAGAAVAAAAGATGAKGLINTPSAPGIGQDVVLDGSGSTTSSGASSLSYAWTLVDGSSVASITGAATSPTVTLHALTAGSFTVKLVVTDNLGKVGVAFRTINTDVPTAVISGVASVVAGGTLQLSGASSTASGTQSIAGYAWSVTPNTVATISGSGATVTLTAVAAGTATVTLTVTDDAGVTATTTSAVTVTAATSTGTGGGTTSGGGGGGGAANPAWLAALVVAGLLLAPRRRGRRRD